MGLVQDGLVVDCGSGGVQDFCVVGGFVVENFAEALAVESIKSVGLWLCDGGRLHSM